jgi:uncharacterized protein
MFVGWMFLNGLGIRQDEAQAMQWFERAAALGSVQGQFYYGRYLTRIGRLDEACTLYRSAAKAGHLPSIFWVGYALARGQGVDRDVKEAYWYLLQAAKRGHVHALREIALLDMGGNRGPFWRLPGLVEFIVAIAAAFVLALINRESDLLRA